MTSRKRVVKLTNCRVLKDHKVQHNDDVWWAETNGKATIIDGQKRFWDAQTMVVDAADVVFDCNGLIAAPGYLDLQINGAYGVDFTNPEKGAGVAYCARRLVKTGCTSFCPTVISSTPDTYRNTIPVLREYIASQHTDRNQKETAAEVLGLHLEGPFISNKGTHDEKKLLAPGSGGIERVYGGTKDIAIVTLAPEMDGASNAIEGLTTKGVVVSLGHTRCDLAQAQAGVQQGGSFITHLFNAMAPFHHRDPGLIGLLGVKSLHPKFFYGLIADGFHAHPASVRIAHGAHPNGAVIVTDAMEAMGLPDGQFSLGSINVTLKAGVVKKSGTDTLAGAACPIDQCVRNFRRFTDCSMVEAVEAASLHPAQCLSIADRKGSLAVGCDADVILLDDDLFVQAVFVNGQLAWSNPNSVRQRKAKL